MGNKESAIRERKSEREFIENEMGRPYEKKY